MSDGGVNSTVLTDAWLRQVSDCIMQAWAEQAFFRPQDRPDGLKALLERRPDMDARVRAVATLIETVGSRAATAGALSEDEYDGLVLRPLHAALPFLDATVRKELARNLVALHLASS